MIILNYESKVECNTGVQFIKSVVLSVNFR